MGHRFRLLAAAWLPLCAAALPLSCTAYAPDALRTARGTYDVRTVGCLDIAIRALRDPVVAFSVGNRCDYPVGVDFRNVVVHAWSEQGGEYHPEPDDPRAELREAVIDAHALVDVALDFPVPVATPSFCVEVGRLNVDAPSPRPEEMCFEYGDGWRRVSEPRRRPPPDNANADAPDLERWP